MTRLLRRSLSATLLVVTLAVGAAACIPTAAPAPSAPSGWAQSMLNQVNLQRSAVGLPGLVWCNSLGRAAQSQSEYQAAIRTMTHDGGGGLELRVESAGYRGWSNLAENVAARIDTTEAAMGLWMNSPGHRAHILSPTFTHFGAGGAASDHRYWTQDFGRGGSC
jgi:uncharacterized protein YkwD